MQALMHLSIIVALALAACATGGERRTEPRATAFAVINCWGFSIDRLSWLAGTWIGEEDGVSMEEVWLAPRGGMMLGLHRDVPATGEAFFEFLRIEERSRGEVVYLASPRGAPPTSFLHTGCVDGVAQFINPGHDYPQRIVYERLGGDSLRASIHGMEDGEERSTSWTWRRQHGVGE
ncbi:MAG TPA: DUF6265 family protein [Gemmatimonadota bacterium]|nr:DUF6265 family protein [Gemmatimonadota bacterium]